MFFNAHFYHSSRRSGGVIHPMRAMGAILADSALTGVVDWTQLHDEANIQRFRYKFGEDEAARQLANGLLDHYDLDLRSHEAYENGGGYAFSHQTPQLVELVAKACRLTDRDKAKGIAHNFIESGVDVNLLREHPEIQDQGRQALMNVDRARVTGYLAQLLDLDAEDTVQKLSQYTELATRHDLKAVDGWVEL